MQNAETKIIVCVIKCKEKYLILKGAPWMKTYPNLWSIVTGKIEDNESPRQAAEREMVEETGQKPITIKEGRVFANKIKIGDYLVNTFLCEIESEKIRITGEHIAFKWVKPNEIFDHKTIPELEQDFKAAGVDAGKPVQQKLF